MLASGIAVLGMWQAWVPQLSLRWNFPAWSLSVEAFFYLLFPFIVAVTATWRWPRALATMLLLYVAVLAAPMLATLLGLVDRGMVQAVLYYNPAMHLPLFTIGVLLGHRFLQRAASRGEHGGVRTWWRATLISLCAVAALVAFVVVGYGMPVQFFQAGLFAPFFAFLIYSLARGDGAIGWLLSTRVMTVLGEASYGVYILQYPLHEWALRVTRWLGGSDEFIRGPAFFPLYAAVLIGVAILSYYRLERPARRAIKARLAL
jgi:peptidoglycan/LPS O-acetylase OafA/YrhL